MGTDAYGAGVRAVEMGTGAAEEEGDVRFDAAQHRCAAGVREQADGHFRVGDAGGLGHHSVSRGGEDA